MLLMPLFTIKSKALPKAVLKDKLERIKRSAQRRGYQCTLSLANVERLLTATHCEYTGVAFDSKNTMSIERIDNSKGYIPGNVIPVITMVNQIKSDNDLEQLTELKEHFDRKHQARLKEFMLSLSSVQRKIKGREDQIKALQKQINKLETDVLRLADEIERMNRGEDEHFQNAQIVGKIITHLKENNKSAEKYMTFWQRLGHSINTKLKRIKLKS